MAIWIFDHFHIHTAHTHTYNEFNENWRIKSNNIDGDNNNNKNEVLLCVAAVCCCWCSCYILCKCHKHISFHDCSFYFFFRSHRFLLLSLLVSFTFTNENWFCIPSIFNFMTLLSVSLCAQQHIDFQPLFIPVYFSFICFTFYAVLCLAHSPLFVIIFLWHCNNSIWTKSIVANNKAKSNRPEYNMFWASFCHSLGSDYREQEKMLKYCSVCHSVH